MRRVLLPILGLSFSLMADLAPSPCQKGSGFVRSNGTERFLATDGVTCEDVGKSEFLSKPNHSYNSSLCASALPLINRELSIRPAPPAPPWVM
ncbi:hypothetical protein SKAU_G00077550 [Synaphobranchus kaupii]|uniref:Uncharacterized protein n=1 Tax=Synaphobranchus kaupii TaxID=118154 RepID=A0A9Q1JCB3_SYNKA|nr:hypothetical protein SKAU_G00077550 [Synaphobranchus kaupii]